MVLPVASYGLKYICKHTKLVNFQWDDPDSGSQWSVVQYVNYGEPEPEDSFIAEFLIGGLWGMTSVYSSAI